MQKSYGVVKAIIRTEKSNAQEPGGKYLFWEDMKSNNIEIKRAVEEIYKKKVTKVNTTIVRGKKKKVRYKEGYTSDWKKAIVTLRRGEKIDAT